MSDFYAEDDPRYASEAFELEQAVRRELPDELEVRSAPGKKGVLTDLIVDLATGGVVAGLVEVFKAWLATKPVHRKIDLQFEVDETTKGKRTGKLYLDASNIDSASLAIVTGEAFNARG